MGRTRLFQKAGSPLIEGHSRTQRPFVTDWFYGYVAAVATAAVAMTVWGVATGAAFHGGWIDAIFEVLNMSLILYGPGAFIGAGLGVLVGRHYGAFRPWRAGWLAGTVFGAVSIYVVITVLSAFITVSNV